MVTEQRARGAATFNVHTVVFRMRPFFVNILTNPIRIFLKRRFSSTNIYAVFIRYFGYQTFATRFRLFGQFTIRRELENSKISMRRCLQCTQVLARLESRGQPELDSLSKAAVERHSAPVGNHRVTDFVEVRWAAASPLQAVQSKCRLEGDACGRSHGATAIQGSHSHRQPLHG